MGPRKKSLIAFTSAFFRISEVTADAVEGLLVTLDRLVQILGRIVGIQRPWATFVLMIADASLLARFDPA